MTLPGELRLEGAHQTPQDTQRIPSPSCFSPAAGGFFPGAAW